ANPPDPPDPAEDPANSEVFHALLMISFGCDLSLLTNHMWSVLLMLAAWSFGSRWRVVGPAIAAVALC
ncbi:MAG: hypothetical protein WD826_00885, partial [Actinomycetota bacterium]